MLTYVDEQIGRILDRLVDLGIAENTIIIVTSDNGGYQLAVQRADRDVLIRGYKTQLWEGGIRVPFIVSDPRYQSKSGNVYSLQN